MKKQDEIIKAISKNKRISISVINSKEMVEKARLIHASTPVVTVAVGRMLSISSIIGIDMKKKDASLTTRINGGGPVGAIIVVTDSFGNPRCFVQHPNADLPKRAKGNLRVGEIVGKNGVLTVIRDMRTKSPYIGSTALVSGEIAEDFTVYFAESEQVRSVCVLGVLIDKDGSVLASGGYLAKLLPGASDTDIDLLEANVAKTGVVTEFLKEVGGAENLLSSVMDGFSPQVLSHNNVEYKCTCNRERFLSAVLSLSKIELDDIKKKGEPIETSCQFCKAEYKFEINEIFK